MHKRIGHENISFPEFVFTSELKETSTPKREKFIKDLSDLKLYLIATVYMSTESFKRNMSYKGLPKNGEPYPFLNTCI